MRVDIFFLSVLCILGDGLWVGLDWIDGDFLIIGMGRNDCREIGFDGKCSR
jgi:hypothetical protein